MREIDFRAWDSLKMKMIPDFTNYAGWEARDGYNTWRMDRYKKMEWTGEKDINGIKIYEGDLIIQTYYLGDDDDIHSKVLFKIVFNEGRFNYVRIIGEMPYNSYKRTTEVIGNIFENEVFLQLSVHHKEEE